MSGIGTVNGVVGVLPTIFYKRGQRLWNAVAMQVERCRKVKGRGSPVNGGTSFQWIVSNGDTGALKNRAGGYTVTPSSDVVDSDKVNLTLNRGIYSASFGFTDQELALIGSYAGDRDASEIVENLWGEEWTRKEGVIARGIEIDIVNGTGTASGTNNIVGFLNALATSGTYAGQSFGGSTNPGLIASISTPAGGNFTRASARQLMASIEQATGHVPVDYIEASPLTCTYLMGVADNQIRFANDQDVRDLMHKSGMRSNPRVPVGSLLGVPIYANSAWGLTSNSSPAASEDGYVLFGSSEKTLLDVLTYTPAQDAFISAISEAKSVNNFEEMPVGLPVRSWAQAKTAASRVVTLDIEVGFGVLQPNAFGLMGGITGFTKDSA